MFYKLKFYYKTYKRFGLRAILFLVASKFKKNKIDNIRLKNVNTSISLSNFGTDVTTLFQIFFVGEYNVSLKGSPDFIIDCGANIGLSAVFFANKYPKAKIFAIEPDKNNFKFLKQNTSLFKNVICINKAIWSHSSKMDIVDTNTGNWGLQTVEALFENENTVEGVSIDIIMAEYKIERIDLLKIDIEGAEKELFSKNYENWLSKTKVLAIELHDTTDNNITEIFNNAIKHYANKKYYLGENLICEFN
jgi:FkbM family methyltransferase